EFTLFDVESGFLLLELEGLLLDAADGTTSDPFFDSLNISPKLLARRLRTRHVAVRPIGKTPTGAFIQALENLGISVREDGDYSVVLTNDYLREELKNFNQRAIHERREWMPVKLTGNLLWFGPLFHPSQDACWACLARRIIRNREAEIYVQEHGTPEE